MNNKNMLLVLVSASFVANYANAGFPQSSSSEFEEISRRQYSNDALGQQQQRSADFLEAIEQYSRANPDKKPDAPDVFEHNTNMLKGGRPFWRKRIFFGKDESGKDCYRRIMEHEANPAFGEVTLVLFHEAAWWNPWSKDSVETLGKYSDKLLHSRFLKKAAAKGGVWCPVQKAFVAGTKNKNICTELAQDYAVQQAMHKSKTKV